MSKKSMVFERTDYVIGLFDWNDWKLRRERELTVCSVCSSNASASKSHEDYTDNESLYVLFRRANFKQVLNSGRKNQNQGFGRETIDVSSPS